MLTRRRFAHLGAAVTASAALPGSAALGSLLQPASPVVGADTKLEIAPFTLEPSPKHRIQTLAYNGQVPGPVLRMKEGQSVTVEIRNGSTTPDLVHWHGLFLPPEIDGAMEEGTPMIAPGASTRFTLTPNPAGFRWFHTHTAAGNNLRAAQYGGEHGFLWIEAADPAQRLPAHDQEFFLTLHDWNGREVGSDDGSTMPVYEISTINGRMLGSGEPLRVKPDTRVLFHVLNSSPTEAHWVALSGHQFRVVALDGNPVPSPATVPMLFLAPAERVSAIVEMNAPGVWVFGEVRKHIHAAGMGIVVEYANSTGQPRWDQPSGLSWDYGIFAASTSAVPPSPGEEITEIALTFEPRFHGHGAEETWLINGKSYPETESPVLKQGQRYRLVMHNKSPDDHPVHLHRHVFQVKRLGRGPELHGLTKDVIYIPANEISEVEFVADNPGATLLHCHQQNHMDRGFMMVFRYA